MEKWEYRNKSVQGAVGVGAAIGYFTGLGYGVSIPLLDNGEYDLVVDMESDLKKVQVKTTKFWRRGRWNLKIATEGGNRSNGNLRRYLNPASIDYLFALVEDGTCYLIPSEAIGGTSLLCLGPKYEEFIVRRGSQEAEGAVLERQ